MPDEEKIDVDIDEEVETDEEEKKGLTLKKYGIYGAIVIVMMAAAYFVTLKVVKPMFAGDGTTVEETVEENAEGNSEDSHKPKEKKDDGGHKTLAGHGSGDEEDESIFLIEDIIVNPAGTGGRRFLSTSIGFEMYTSGASDIIKQREAIVRDALITILSSQSIPELSDFKQRERLRKLIKLRVEKLLHIDEIAAVYFTEFVLQ